MSKPYKKKRRRRKQRHSVSRILIPVICLIVVLSGAVGGVWYYKEYGGDPVRTYETATYNSNLYQGSLFADDLCVAADDVALTGFDDEDSLHAAGLFNLNDKTVEYGYKLYDKLYPASTTKLMTAYLAFKYGNMDDIVTVSDSVSSFASDEVVCNLQPGDTVTLYDLLCGLLLRSGNDCGVAIAEHISGSVEAFAELMNSEAKALGATGSHFVNPHGLHNENHYTTAYDLYLIFNEAIKYDSFNEIIHMTSYQTAYYDKDGKAKELTVNSTNRFLRGDFQAPENITVIGGKTGTTNAAGHCLILLSRDTSGAPYISVILNSSASDVLYPEMVQLLEQINK